MKNLVLPSLILVCVVAAVITFRTREKSVALRHFTWTERESVVTFEFHVANLSDAEISASIELVAERTRESRIGPQIAEAGRRRVEVRLAAREEKKERGQLLLASGLKGHLTVFPYVTVQKPNKAPEPTLTIRPFSMLPSPLESLSSLWVSVAHL